MGAKFHGPPSSLQIRPRLINCTELECASKRRLRAIAPTSVAWHYGGKDVIVLVAMHKTEDEMVRLTLDVARDWELDQSRRSIKA